MSIDVPVARLHTHTELTMPVRVIRGRRPGPTLFVCAAIHGDEINGVEVIRRLLRMRNLVRIAGTLIAVPVVNVFGFVGHSRYLPDRRDLNRVFPGSDRGSLAARLADLFMTEIVSQATHGIDLHTGALHRSNLPHVRVADSDEESLALAKSFGAPVILRSNLRDGSLREAVAARGVPVLMFEAGEALRFDEWAIRSGLRGVVNVMQAIGMLNKREPIKKRRDPLFSASSTWVRAQQSGILRGRVRLGALVREGQLLGTVGDPFSEDAQDDQDVLSPSDGVVIGQTHLPLVYEGDALFHVARLERTVEAGEIIDAYHESMQADLTLGRGFDPELGPPETREGES